MQRNGRFILVFLIIFCLFQHSFIVASFSKEIPLITLGDTFPETSMPTPKSPDERQYLGLTDKTTFVLSKVKADLVLVEILSVYCPTCQRQAPHYNKLFDLIEKDPNLKGRIKLLGIAAGNGDMEIQKFKERLKIRFPIVQDIDFMMHEAIGGSRTPFSIYVRQSEEGQAGVVAGTHLGKQSEIDKLLADLGALMTLDRLAISAKGRDLERRAVSVEPVLADDEIRVKVMAAFKAVGGELSQFKQLGIEGAKQFYSGRVTHEGETRKLFAEVVSRPPTCDVCHDIHFIYVFDASGEVLDFEPLQLTKYGNDDWDEEDLAKMRARVMGRSLLKPWPFNPKTDAVTSATITSAVIFNSLSKGASLIQELKKKGML